MNSPIKTPSNAQVWRFDNANALHYALIDAVSSAVTRVVSQGRNPVLALPTGNTMVPFYRIAAEREAALQIATWRCFNLDEYYPVTPENEADSFRAYMKSHFYSRLKTQALEEEFLNGSAANLENECARFENKLKSAGGIDIALLGIGTNGHIAFNEPGSEFDSKTRSIELHPQTLMANFQGRAPFTHAMTMGIATILEAQKVFIVALGKNKATSVRDAINLSLTRATPATALQVHPDVTWFLDQDAASLL
ncbi:MAG: glucosamine-6-phosphate deaminase [Bdellovibrionales bacterium]|nr:glucosamine-6-phosphate deaminase [Oligoflexia bacterium]